MQANILLLITAAIWGFGFVAQRLGMNYLEPFTFNGVRFLLGGVSLIPLIYWLSVRSAIGINSGSEQHRSFAASFPIKEGCIAGLLLFIASSLQQWGLTQTSATKAGFITGLYIIVVPFLGFFLKHKITRAAWAGAIIAVLGLYLLSFGGHETFSLTDGLVLISAIVWAFHLLALDFYSKYCAVIALAAFQFFVCSLLSFGVAFITETPSMALIVDAWQPIIYAGLVSVGIAYTLQVVAQKTAQPTQAAIIMSLESAFAAIGGVWLLNETLSIQGWIGCALMLVGMLVSQIPSRK